MERNNLTIYIEDGQEVYPCRCGETHRGPYAMYGYGHHNCLHYEPLIVSEPDQGICPLCGESFMLAWCSKEEQDAQKG